jgi:hypothetical protein
MHCYTGSTPADRSAGDLYLGVLRFTTRISYRIAKHVWQHEFEPGCVRLIVENSFGQEYLRKLITCMFDGYVHTARCVRVSLSSRKRKSQISRNVEQAVM